MQCEGGAVSGVLVQGPARTEAGHALAGDAREGLGPGARRIGASGIHFEFPGDGNPFEGPAYEDLGAGNVGGLFDRLFQGAGRPGGVARARGQVLRQPVTVSLAEAYRGSSRTVQVQRPEPCPTCGGSGRVGNVGCHACHGSGRHAGGTRLEVTIPPGVETGTKIRLRGKGGPGTGGGPAGDVVLEVQIAEDSRFERRGAALHTEAPVPLTIAVLGGEVTLPTVTGEIALRVPEGTQNGRVFRLSGRGMPVMNSDKVGDLFAKVRVILPEQLTDIQRALFAQLRDLESGETTAASA